MNDPHPADRTPVVDDLLRSLPTDAVATDPEILGAHRRDQAPLVEAGAPLALVRPRSASEVQEILRIASRHGVPVVPRGAGSGLSGGANAVDGCLVVSLARMDQILEVDTESRYVVVEPGVLNGDLSRAALERGLWYPPDPASAEFSTIGGNIATNAGGLCCVKYGVTREFVLGLDVVLADGTSVRVGRKTVKGVAGYDLTGLFVGSEGTLGVVTRATLRLLPPPPAAPATLVASFPDLKAAGAAIAAITSRSVPSLLELMDRATIAAIERWKPMDLDVEAAGLLVARSDVGAEQAATEIEGMARLSQEAGASLVVRSTDPVEADLLMTARRLAFPALERQGTALLDDVAVPTGRIPELLEAIERIAERHDVVIGTFGHAGDGNMHPTIVFDGGDPDAVERARAAFDDIVATAIRLGGTVTGEHGVGVLKRASLRREAGPDTFRLHRLVKSALDPTNILNPGKVVYPTDADPAGERLGEG